ncbi:hypothetical protein ACVLV4_002192 [Rathayibacter agropyri]
MSMTLSPPPPLMNSWRKTKLPGVVGTSRPSPLFAFRLTCWITRGCLYGMRTNSANRREQLISAGLFVASIVLFPLILVVQFLLLLHPGCHYILRDERGPAAVIAVIRDSSTPTWFVRDHVSRHPGSGKGKALRALVVPELRRVADESGIEVVWVAATEGLANRFREEMPGLLDDGEVWPRGQRLRYASSPRSFALQQEIRAGMHADTIQLLWLSSGLLGLYVVWGLSDVSGGSITARVLLSVLVASIALAPWIAHRRYRGATSGQVNRVAATIMRTAIVGASFWAAASFNFGHESLFPLSFFVIWYLLIVLGILFLFYQGALDTQQYALNAKIQNQQNEDIRHAIQILIERTPPQKEPRRRIPRLFDRLRAAIRRPRA